MKRKIVGQIIFGIILEIEENEDAREKLGEMKVKDLIKKDGLDIIRVAEEK